MTGSGNQRWATFGVAALLVLGVSAITMGSSEVAAVGPEAPQEGTSAPKSGGSTDASRAPTATEQARYYIPHVQEAINVNNTFCSTAIVVTTPFMSFASGVKIEIEVFSDIGTTLILQTVAPAGLPGKRWTIITDDELQVPFNTLDRNLDLGNFTGFAIVSASDPRLFVTAYDYCRTGTGALDDLVSMTAIEVYPLGTTLDFLKAGLPLSRAQPMTSE